MHKKDARIAHYPKTVLTLFQSVCEVDNTIIYEKYNRHMEPDIANYRGCHESGWAGSAQESRLREYDGLQDWLKHCKKEPATANSSTSNNKE